MPNPALGYLIVELLIVVIGVGIALLIIVPLLRWIFCINAMVENQQRIIAELQRLNDNHSSSNNPS